MGYREPRPGSPARLSVKTVSAAYDSQEGNIEVAVKMSYDVYCCNGTHELIDAGKAVERLFRKYDDMFYDPTTDPDEERWHEENMKDE